MTETAYALYVGIDWGTATHQVAVLDTLRAPLGERAVAHDGAALQTFTEWLTLLASGEPARVAVALEVPRGAVVDTRSTASATATRSRAPKTIVGMLSCWPPLWQPTGRPSGGSSSRIL
jgi:hypothetical protein